MQLHPKQDKPTHWLGCGKCIGCRELRAATWSIRLEHEARYHSHNTFLTPTYDDENLPDGLQKRHLQLFWKKLRHRFNNSLKYYACGEYGEQTRRPHYHAAVFGLPIFEDSKLWKGDNYVSDELNEIWGLGMVTQAELTPSRIRYTAGYVLKKAGHKTQTYCDEDGVELEPPFQLMSKGLGAQWIKDFHNDIRNGYVMDSATKKRGIPRYYLDWLKRQAPERKTLPILRTGTCPKETLQTLVEKAKLTTLASLPENDPARNLAALIIKEQQIAEKRRRKYF